PRRALLRQRYRAIAALLFDFEFQEKRGAVGGDNLHAHAIALVSDRGPLGIGRTSRNFNHWCFGRISGVVSSHRDFPRNMLTRGGLPCLCGSGGGLFWRGRGRLP